MMVMCFAYFSSLLLHNCSDELIYYRSPYSSNGGTDRRLVFNQFRCDIKWEYQSILDPIQCLLYRKINYVIIILKIHIYPEPLLFYSSNIFSSISQMWKCKSPKRGRFIRFSKSNLENRHLRKWWHIQEIATWIQKANYLCEFICCNFITYYLPMKCCQQSIQYHCRQTRQP